MPLKTVSKGQASFTWFIWAIFAVTIIIIDSIKGYRCRTIQTGERLWFIIEMMIWKQEKNFDSERELGFKDKSELKCKQFDPERNSMCIINVWYIRKLKKKQPLVDKTISTTVSWYDSVYVAWGSYKITLLNLNLIRPQLSSLPPYSHILAQIRTPINIINFTYRFSICRSVSVWVPWTSFEPNLTQPLKYVRTDKV